jgi:hypothetical protein
MKFKNKEEFVKHLGISVSEFDNLKTHNMKEIIKDMKKEIKDGKFKFDDILVKR